MSVSEDFTPRCSGGQRTREACEHVTETLFFPRLRTEIDMNVLLGVTVR